MINQNEAPEGYIAVEPIEFFYGKTGTCNGCYFYTHSGKCGECFPNQRSDNHHVIFIKK